VSDKTSAPINDSGVTTGHIHILPPEEARRIAAGEVVDRPAALIREFLDNAIDANASNIEAAIEEGGSKKVEVADDGNGMNYDDLRLCWLAHATSKITSLDDLNTAETLGFRGEALAAAAAVARLEIVSSIGSGEAWRLEVGPGERNAPQMTGLSRTRGSTVRALNLYDTIPARKHFLKREGTEAALCSQVFIEKALAFPCINFRFTQDGRNKFFFPVAPSLKERFTQALLDPQKRNFLYEISVTGNGFSAELVIGGPELSRNDRRMLYVFANGRRIQDYSLITAMEYGTQGWFPNGTHPVGAVFIDIDPSLADFNIHPAKREARFRDPGAIHHAISSGLRDFCHSLGLKNGAYSGQNLQTHEGEMTVNDGLVIEALFDRPASPVSGQGDRFYYLAQKKNELNPIEVANYVNSIVNSGAVAEAAPSYDQIRYVGTVFGFFILVEWGNKLYIIDQHAAHERILYNRFLTAPITKQELLIPISFITESADDDSFLETKKEELARLAIIIERDENGWRIDALPEGWRLGDAETVRNILDLRTASENIAERWAATLCCHQALRDGDTIDNETAIALAKEALALPDPRCPHGRPVWTEISREALCKSVRRS
jgi:DNA mismatch repair protein MutL